MGATEIRRSRTYMTNLPPNRSAAWCAREVVARELTGWGLGDLIESASLVTSELVANAARQERVFSLVLTAEEKAVLVEVIDSSSEVPVVRDAYGDDDNENGRGMMIVAAIAAEWGVRPERTGKTVWARVTS